jgi:hypothetical protein
MTDNFYASLAAWIDGVMSEPLPAGIAAFNFNLYDGGAPDAFELELVGAPSFSADDEDWASDDIFMSHPPRFLLPHGLVGPAWEAGLGAAAVLLVRYLASAHAGALRLRRSQAVAVGFVDGNLQIIWSAA